VGIIGAGLVGSALFDAIVDGGLAEVQYVLVPEDLDLGPLQPRMRERVVTSPKKAFRTSTDLVIEAAHPDVIVQHAADILTHSDLCAFSCSALADRRTEEAIRDAAKSRGSRFFVPHGAILALDGLRDGRDVIDEVVVTTTKSGSSLGLPETAAGTLFDGSTRDACVRFPRNVNVHAAVALAGIGFDRTRSIVVAERGTRAMRHHIRVAGQGLEWDIAVTSMSLGGVSGSYTPNSAVGTVKQLLAYEPIVML
jgi:aspartate dehydrogenase